VVDLLLIRHALPQRVEVVGRPADPELSETGHRQAMALAEWLSHEPLDALYVSPMRRARQTAQPLAAVTGLDPVVEEGVAEFDRHAEAYVPMEELKAEDDPRYRELLDGAYFDGGELDAEGFQRTVVGAVDRIIADNRSRTAAVVCHGGVINAYVGHVLGLSDFMVFEPAYTGITRIRASSRGHRMVVTLNEFGHLRDLRPDAVPAAR
jgi:probable phosphoglycerate mutase